MTTHSVRFDGLYHAVSAATGVERVTAYLRFYADGTVLRTTSTGVAGDVAKWLVKGFRAGPWNTDGAYTISDALIELKFHLKQDKSHALYNDKVQDGDVSYRGRIDGERLILRSLDNIARSGAEWIFHFMPINDLK